MGDLINKLFSFCKRAAKADVVRVFSFTAMSTLVKMLTGLIGVKIVASLIGPVGVVLVGQLNSFAAIAMSFSSGGINSGITKYIAEYKDDHDKVVDFLSTALRITTVCSVITGLLMVLFNGFLSKTVMLSPNYGYVFIVFGFTILLYSLNMMLTSIINGFKEFEKYVAINIANSIIGLIFTLSFVFTLGLKGVLISAVTYQSVMLFITLWMIRKLPWVNKAYFKAKLNVIISRQYFRYTIMSLIIAVTVPVVQIFLRGYVMSDISLIDAGWWEAMNRISNMYLMVITTSFSVYYLPKLSELTDDFELRREIFRAYKVIIPILVVGFVSIYFFRFILIQILFTPEFYPMENLFAWQLTGDFFKISSWLLAFVMVAKSMSKVFIITEVFFALSYAVLGYTFLSIGGVVGLVQAHVVNYVIYMICMLVIFRKLIFLRK